MDAISPIARRSGRLAFLELSGMLSEWSHPLSMMSQTMQALSDPGIAAVALLVDSPGGEVPVSLRIADDISELRKQKPIHAYVPRIATSAGYLMASSSTSVYAGEGSVLGNVGVIWTRPEITNQEGYKVHVVSSGEGKTMMHPNTPFTESDRQRIQDMVDEMDEIFVSKVSTGRSVPKETVQQWKPVFSARMAAEKGLIDGVISFRQFVQQFRGKYESFG